MPKFIFENIAINSTAKKKPTEQDKDTYIGLEHLDPQCLEVTRFGGDVAPIGEKLLMKKGDVLFGKRRAYQKKVGIAPFDGIFSAHGLVLRPKEEVITKEFFPFFISSDYFLDKAIEISVGSLSPTINWSDLKKLEFNIPEIDKQNEYAPILWAFNDTKNKYLKLLADLNLLINSQFIEMLSSLKYEEKTIKEIVEYLPKSTLGASIGKEKGLYPFFTSSVEQSKWCDEYLYNDKAIILGNGGTASVNYYDGKFSTTNHSFVIKSCDENTIDTKYIYYYLLFNIDILEKGFHGVGLKNISKDYINEIDIPCINITEQNRIIDIIELLDKSKFLIQKIQKNIIFLINFLKSNKKYINYAIIKAIKLKGEHYV